MNFDLTPLILACILATITNVDSLSCIDCNERKCRTREQLGCIGGYDIEACGCCETCAKLVGEKCGGPWNIAGTCDKGLKCTCGGEKCFDFEAGFCTSYNML
ncbi:Uncharacterised protein g1934 [Pycnogonum litorale]